jgi:hypothetical protein
MVAMGSQKPVLEPMSEMDAHFKGLKKGKKMALKGVKQKPTFA